MTLNKSPVLVAPCRRHLSCTTAADFSSLARRHRHLFKCKKHLNRWKYARSRWSRENWYFTFKNLGACATWWWKPHYPTFSCLDPISQCDGWMANTSQSKRDDTQAPWCSVWLQVWRSCAGTLAPGQVTPEVDRPHPPSVTVLETEVCWLLRPPHLRTNLPR